MDSGRFARLKEVILGAVDLTAEERRLFLDRACPNDPDLRREAEELLSHDQKTRDFLAAGEPSAAKAPSPGQPPTGFDSGATTTVPLGRFSGQRVSHYEIVELIGEGGMGRVYRARDARLARDVALKFISPDLARDPDHVRRFEQEARAAGALNHPNIVAIHDIVAHESAPFVVMELLEGQSLRERLGQGPVPSRKAIDYAAQVARGLAAAHAKGIVHRDIKPENLFLTGDGRIKIFDFGVAKLTGGEALASPAERLANSPGVRPVEPPRGGALTGPGAIIGTSGYMSPEQARGRLADARSDIFALGATLYEMLAGRRAFRKDSFLETLHAIVNEDPPSFAACGCEVSPGLEAIVLRCLEKNPGERFQSALDLAFALEGASGSGERTGAAIAGGSGSGRRVAPRSFRGTMAWILPLLVAAIAGWFGWQRHASPVPRGTPVQVTSADAWEGQPALSPDGSRIAYASDEAGNSEIYVVDVHGGTPLRITSDPATDNCPAWFPDGSGLVFTSDRGGQAGIWKTGQFGGGATLLVPDAWQPAVSPDGSRIAFVRSGANRYARIAVAPLADPERVTVLTDDKGGPFDHESPAWSPDGRRICYATRHGLWTVPAAGGVPRRLTTDLELDCDPAWAPSGKHVYFSSYRQGTVALWRVGDGGGAPERITLGTSQESHPSLSRDGGRLAYATQIMTRNLVLHDLPSGHETILRSLPDTYQAAFSADGRWLVFVSPGVGKELALWLQPLSGGLPDGPPHQLTDHPGDASQPSFSPDGRFIAYLRIIQQQRDVWVIPVGGGQSVRFTDDPAPDMNPAWSPEGSSIAFASAREDSVSRIWIAPVREGQPAGPARRLDAGAVLAFAPSWSRDGSQIAFVGASPGGNDAWVAPADGSAPARQLTSGVVVMRAHWDGVRGDLLVCGVWTGHRYTLRRVSPRDGSVSDLDPPCDVGPDASPPTFDLSLDGRVAVYPREETRGDVWLLETRGGSY